MKKTKILSVLLIFIILIAAIGFTGCMSSPEPNRELPEENPEQLYEFENGPFSYNPELEGTMMFCIKYIYDDFELISSLIAVTKDGREIVIISDTYNVNVDGDNSNCLRYFDYYRNRLYLSFFQGFAYIDLDKGDGRYDAHYLPNTEFYDSGFDFVVTSDSLFFGNLFDVRYSLVDGSFETAAFPNIESNYSALKYDKDGNHLILWCEDSSVKLIDCVTGEEQNILTDVYLIENVCYGKILFIKEVNQEYAEYELFEYDIKSGKSTALSDVISIGTWDYSKDTIIPYGNNRYIYVHVLYDSQVCQVIISDNGVCKIVAEFDGLPGLYISVLSDDLVSIKNSAVFGDEGNDIVMGGLLNVTLDINTGTITDSDIGFYYSFEVWADGFNS